MKTVDGSKKIKFLCLITCLFIIMICGYLYYNYLTYRSIKVVVDDTMVVEYGSSNYDINKLIKQIDGEIVSIKKDIDTKKVGEQEIIIEVKKDNITKEIPIKISVIDSVAPEIKIKEEKVTISKGDSFDLNSNIDSVIDEVDGEIPLLVKAKDSRVDEIETNEALINLTVGENKNYEDSVVSKEKNTLNKYYEFSYSKENINSVGSHEVNVVATDSYGNVSMASFILEIIDKKLNERMVPVFTDSFSNERVSDLVSIAYSLVGSPYVAGGNGPYGFDCSGFVQYVYLQVGVNVSRSSSTQLYDGVSVDYQNAQPGDILSWGYSDGVATHSALYVGNGQMIHATNPSLGVIASDVLAWTRGSGTRVISIRRIK